MGGGGLLMMFVHLKYLRGFISYFLIQHFQFHLIIHLILMFTHNLLESAHLCGSVTVEVL